MAKNKWKIRRRPVIGHDPFSGKVIREYVYANTEAEYKKNLKLAKMNASEKFGRSNITFGKYADRWMLLYKNNLQEQSQDTLKTSLRRLKDIYDIPLCKITSDHLQEIINKNAEHPRSCQRIKNLANQIFARAVYDRFLDANPCSFLELPTYAAPEKRILTEEEKKAFKEALKNLPPMYRVFAECEYYFGLRPQECRGLKKQDFDLKEKQVTIRRAAAFVRPKAKKGGIKQTKNYKVRTLPIPDSFLPSIKSYLEGLKEDYLFTERGELLTEWYYKKLYTAVFSEINKELGGDEETNLAEGLSFYTFRHTYCTFLYYHTTVENGISVKMAAYLGGHTIDVFLKIYAHLDLEKERTAAANILSEL